MAEVPNDVPEWAIEKADKLLDAEAANGKTGYVRAAFARYITKHEEAPDPVEIEVARLLPNAKLHPLDVVIRNALKRGIELAKSGATT